MNTIAKYASGVAAPVFGALILVSCGGGGGGSPAGNTAPTGGGPSALPIGSAGDGASTVSVAGTSYRYNNLQIDGAQNNDLYSNAPNPLRSAVDIVWIQHDIAGDNSLQIAFDSNKTGYYRNPDPAGFLWSLRRRFTSISRPRLA